VTCRPSASVTTASVVRSRGTHGKGVAHRGSVERRLPAPGRARRRVPEGKGSKHGQRAARPSSHSPQPRPSYGSPVARRSRTPNPEPRTLEPRTPEP
jgi:hypothetical protein